MMSQTCSKRFIIHRTGPDSRYTLAPHTIEIAVDALRDQSDVPDHVQVIRLAVVRAKNAVATWTEDQTTTNNSDM